ncbi:TMEM175 family protein [Mucilaginibacter sp. PAMB04274]|uniref:TMEM175 family protein n=1 Tax=Mucilaginibacter sp. PAMB04274 TaxID=3138568 RepID=UPI0031F64F81
MNAAEQQEIKKEFLLERIILFSDAVFAIIITIMVIEIKMPEHLTTLAEGLKGIKNTDSEKVHQFNHEVKHAFKELVPRLLGYALSFFLVANFWMRHIKICSYLKDYNRTFLVYNLLFLFTISLFPFGISFFAGTAGFNTLLYTYSVNIYISVVLANLLTQALLVGFIVRNKAELCIANPNIETTLQWKVQRLYYFMIPVLGIAVLLFNYFNLNFFFSLYTIPVAAIITGIARRKYYPKK